MLKKLLLAFICSFIMLPVIAQDADTARLFTEMRKLHKAYHSNGLQYQVHYTYSSAARPLQVIDSLRGIVEISASGSRVQMQNMEFVANERYAIVLFKDDQVMYLYKPGVASPGDPMAQLRTMLEQGGLKEIRVQETGRMKQISIRFDSTASVRGIEMQVSMESGLLSSVKYVVETEMMKGGESLSEEERMEYGDLALVTMQMRQYAPLPASRLQMHESAYFTKEADTYIPTEAYKAYQIFKGSLNL